MNLAINFMHTFLVVNMDTLTRRSSSKWGLLVPVDIIVLDIKLFLLFCKLPRENGLVVVSNDSFKSRYIIAEMVEHLTPLLASPWGSFRWHWEKLHFSRLDFGHTLFSHIHGTRIIVGQISKINLSYNI